MDEGQEANDAVLARRAADGCVDSFATLARRYQVPVVHYVRRLTGRVGGDQADDVTQDTFLRAWRLIDQFDCRWTFSTWLFTIARRTWLNHARSARRRRVRETAAAVAGVSFVEPALGMLEEERAARLWDVAAAELSEREFTAVWMRYVEEKSLAEVAAVLGRPIATTKVILFRARRRLAPLVRDLAGWSD